MPVINKAPKLFLSSIFFYSNMVVGETTSIQDTLQITAQAIDPKTQIDQSNIERRQANDLEDMFDEIANTTVGGGMGIAQKIYLRGLEDQKLNVTIDGATQTGIIFQHQGRISVEPELLKQVKISQGAGSALDGFGALGGALHFETKDAADFLSQNKTSGLILKSDYFSNNHGRKLSAHLFGQINPNWQSLISLSRLETGRYQGGDGVKLPLTDIDNNSVLFKLSGQISAHHSINIAFDERRDDGVRSLRPEFTKGSWNEAYKQANNRDTTTFDYAFDDQNDLFNLSLKAYRSDNFISLSREGGEKHVGNIKTYGLDLCNNTQTLNHDINYGLAYRYDKALKHDVNISEKGDIYGLYIQDDYDISDELSLSFGARYDDYTLDDAYGQHFSSQGVSPNANLTYQLADHWLINLGYARALRGHSVKQAFAIINSPNVSQLKEEKATNRELSIEYSSSDFSAGASVFHTNIDDAVGFIGTIGPQNRFYANVGKLTTKGYNLWLEKIWGDTHLNASYSVTLPKLNGQALNDRHYGIGKAFGDRLVLRSSHRLWQPNIELGWTGTFVKRLDSPHDSARTKPGYNVQDVFMQWTPKTSEDLLLTLAVNNLFNQHYFDHGTVRFDPESGMEEIGLPEPGRDIRLSLRWAL